LHIIFAFKELLVVNNIVLNKNIKSIFLLFILLVISSTPIFSQNKAVDFWEAVTPERQPYEKRKLEQCLEKVRRLPLIQAVQKSGTVCPPGITSDTSRKIYGQAVFPCCAGRDTEIVASKI
jgi:hypothetical protein